MFNWLSFRQYLFWLCPFVNSDGCICRLWSNSLRTAANKPLFKKHLKTYPWLYVRPCHRWQTHCFYVKRGPEQNALLLCYDQLRIVLELSLPSSFQDMVCKPKEHGSGSSYTPADIQDVVLTQTSPPEEIKLKHSSLPWKVYCQEMKREGQIRWKKFIYVALWLRLFFLCMLCLRVLFSGIA